MACAHVLFPLPRDRLTETERETGGPYVEQLWQEATVVALPSRYGLWGVFSLKNVSSKEQCERWSVRFDHLILPLCSGLGSPLFVIKGTLLPAEPDEVPESNYYNLAEKYDRMPHRPYPGLAVK